MLPPPNEDNRVADLQRRVENLESALRAAFTTISGGRGLTIDPGGKMVVKHPDGKWLMLMGGYEGPTSGFDMPDGSKQPMALIWRADGSLALGMYDPDPSNGFQQFLAIFDRAGNIVMSDDTDSGQGLARPYLSGGFRPARQTDWGITTSSATFETLWQQYVYKQHPKLTVGLVATMDTAGATGEIRVMVNGVQLDTTRSAEFLVSSQYFTGPVAGSHMQIMDVQIQGRRTSASGALRIEPQYWLGRQS